mmetsp:Transcript_66703/g.195063  ORF Transcript_66703/g.195063 Transcript_66703/m.195063 type:complete len:213 (+) Transcript_66703:558-1196(+)
MFPGVGGHRVVACQAAAPHGIAPVHNVAPFRLQDSMAGNSVSALAEKLPVLSSPAVKAEALLNVVFETVPEAFTPTPPRLRAAPALLAGGARRARGYSSPRKAARHSARTARRATGARLRPSPAPQQRLAPSYDASRLRTKLQLGLRLTMRTHSEKSREAKTSSMSMGVSDRSGLLWAAYFEMIEDHQILTIQTASRPCGVCCCPTGRQPTA